MERSLRSGTEGVCQRRFMRIVTNGGGMSYLKLRLINVGTRRAVSAVRAQAIYVKLRVSKSRENLFTLPSTSNLCKIAIKQVGLSYNYHQYKKTLKRVKF